MKLRNKIRLGGLAAVASYAAYHLYLKVKPARAFPVENFEPERYMGEWRELARLPQRCEKNLIYTSVTYSLMPGDKIKLTHKGYCVKKDKWTSAEGKAIFRGPASRAAWRVSFCGPLYMGYNVVAIDDDYKYALVFGRNTREMWILSRERSLPNNVMERYLALAAYIGADLSKLVWVPQM